MMRQTPPFWKSSAHMSLVERRVESKFWLFHCWWRLDNFIHNRYIVPLHSVNIKKYYVVIFHILVICLCSNCIQWQFKTVKHSLGLFLKGIFHFHALVSTALCWGTEISKREPVLRELWPNGKMVWRMLSLKLEQVARQGYLVEFVCMRGSLGRLQRGNVQENSISPRFILGQLLYSYYLLHRRMHHITIVLRIPGGTRE